jgi:putative ABC transport system permease protein
MAGGIIGILVGISVPLGVRFFTDAISRAIPSVAPLSHVPISVTSVFVAFGVSVAVGVIFGMLPASRASQLNPTEALRYE